MRWSASGGGHLPVTLAGAYAPAGCLTVVTGRDSWACLSAVGANDEVPVHLGAGWGVNTGSAASVVAPADLAGPGGVAAAVLIENNGFEGSRGDVLAELSRLGKAASVFWNVNGLVLFGCARRAKVLASVELLDADPQALPRSLRAFLQDGQSDQGPVAVGMAMAEEFTGVRVPADREVARPSTGYRIDSPIFSVRVTRQELLELGYPTPALVAAVLAASPNARRRLSEWAARAAINHAGLATEPGTRAVLAQVGAGAPSVFGAEASRLRLQAKQSSQAATDALNDDTDNDGGRYRSLQQWMPRYWTVEALAYTTITDDVTAALGATYCASIPRRGTDVEEFLDQARRVLDGG